MSDADMENTETQVSLDFAETCKYISQEEYKELLNNSEGVGRMLNHMVENPEKYSPKH
jgi:four helix bundle protein